MQDKLAFPLQHASASRGRFLAHAYVELKEWWTSWRLLPCKSMVKCLDSYRGPPCGQTRTPVSGDPVAPRDSAHNTFGRTLALFDTVCAEARHAVRNTDALLHLGSVMLSQLHPPWSADN